MSTIKHTKNKLLRGINYNVSGTLDNLILTKKGVIRLKKEKIKKRKK